LASKSLQPRRPDVYEYCGVQSSMLEFASSGIDVFYIEHQYDEQTHFR